MSIITDTDSAILRKRKLYALLQEQSYSREVLNELLPDGKPHKVEGMLWDYKESLPSAKIGIKLSETEKGNLDYKFSCIVKDAVSFYNSYGGYLVIGVSDKPRTTIGWNQEFDCDELNKKIYGATTHQVECHYCTYNIISEGQNFNIGLLLIPQRTDDRRPAQFLKDGPTNTNGQKQYSKNNILFRDGHECRPAESAEDYHFLCSQHRRQFVASRDEVGRTSLLDNTLGARDPGFIRFVGRAELLSELWGWLCDRYVPIKLLAGLGGVGKTTLAREFAEEVVRTSPMGFERVIWLTAKKRLFAPHINDYTPSTRVDFYDLTSLLKSLLLQLGNNESDLDPDYTSTHLVEQTIIALKIVPSFIIIDDVDSLNADDQSEVFHMAIQIANQTHASTNPPSRILLTARLSLGATAAQLMRISGLKSKEFKEYVQMTAQEMGMSTSALGTDKELEQFCKITEGSPTFASSILRLVDLGEPLRQALEHWKGGDGEEVRKFAFEKELDQLLETQIRTLYALCLLGETSNIELRNVTQSNDYRLLDDLAELKKYHLITHATDFPVSGPRLRIPEAIRMMSGLIRNKIHDPKVIEQRVKDMRNGSPESPTKQSYVINRVVALWKENRATDALSDIQFASKRAPKSADLKCLLGRAYLRIDPPDLRCADKAFSEASRLGCQRPELNSLWIETKKRIGDWRGLIDITPTNERALTADLIYVRGEAFAELADSAYNLGNFSESAGFYLKSAKEIDKAFSQKRASGRVLELKEMRSRFLGIYVAIIDMQTVDRDKHLEVWLAVFLAVKHFLRTPEIIRLGLNRIRSWWAAVEEREKIEEMSAKKLRQEIRHLDEVIEICRNQSDPDIDLLKECRLTSEGLSDRLRIYSEKLNESSF